MSGPNRIEQVLNAVTKIDKPDPEVQPKAKRRRFSAEYKLRVVREADACTEPGEIGALLRREGLYSSHLCDWRRLRDEGALEGLKPRKRGRKPRPEKRRIAELQRENTRLRKRLEQAETIIDAQKKLAIALEQLTESEDGESE